MHHVMHNTNIQYTFQLNFLFFNTDFLLKYFHATCFILLTIIGRFLDNKFCHYLQLTAYATDRLFLVLSCRFKNTQVCIHKVRDVLYI